MQVSHAHSDANDLHERAFAPEARLNRPPAGTKLPPHLWWRRSAWRLSQPAGMRKRHACVIADGALAQIARKHTRVRMRGRCVRAGVCVRTVGPAAVECSTRIRIQR